MEPRHDKILTDLSDVITKTLNLFCLLPHLKSRKLVTEKEEQQLSNSTKTDKEKNTECLRILRTKGHRAFLLFVEALNNEKEHLGHEDLVIKLTRADATSPRQREPVSAVHLPPISTTAGQGLSLPAIKYHTFENDDTNATSGRGTTDLLQRDRLAIRHGMPGLVRPAQRIMVRAESNDYSTAQSDAVQRSISSMGTIVSHSTPRSTHDGDSSVTGQHRQLQESAASVGLILKEQLEAITNHISNEFRIFQNKVNHRIEILEQKMENYSVYTP